MKGRYIIKRDGKYVLFNDYNDISVPFDDLIAFQPEWPEPPHSDEDHKLMATFHSKFRELLRRNRDARSN